MIEDELCKIIDRCIDKARPYPDEIGYRRCIDENDNDKYYECDYFIKDWVIRDELEREIASYLRIKEAEINSKLIQVKCDAYELALTHSRPIEKIMQEQQ